MDNKQLEDFDRMNREVLDLLGRNKSTSGLAARLKEEASRYRTELENTSPEKREESLFHYMVSIASLVGVSQLRY